MGFSRAIESATLGRDGNSFAWGVAEIAESNCYKAVLVRFQNSESPERCLATLASLPLSPCPRAPLLGAWQACRRSSSRSS